MKRRKLDATQQSKLNQASWQQRYSRRGRVKPVRVPGVVNIDVTPSPYKDGPYSIKKITVERKREGETVEVDQRWLVDCHGMPLHHGTRKQLDRLLKKYEFGYLKYIMTAGTEAEGM